MVAWVIRGSAPRKKGGAILEQMVVRKTVCLRRLGGDRRGELRAGRFFANPKVTAGRIVASWSERTGAACAGRHVLAIQDRTEVKFPTNAQRRRGLGPVKKGNAYGVLVHAMIAVDAASGSCLGLVGGDVWSRAGVNPRPHAERPLAERESVRWIETAQQAKSVLQPAAMVTVVADREADMYPLWGSTPDARMHVLTRAMKDRALVGGGALFAAAAAAPVAGQREIELPARDPGRPERTALVELRHREVEIVRPQQERDRSLPPSVRLRVIEVRETDPPEGVEALHWRLLTTHPIADAAAAWKIVDWYQLRWVIEQMFRVMKSQGLQLEDSQIATTERLVKLAAVATKAACVDIQLTQGRDGADQMAASNVFSEAEIDTLAALGPTLEGKTERQQNPHPPHSLAWAGWSIARLGGWNCYYKPPGPITFRRGMEHFYQIHRGRQLGMKLKREVRIP
jgi:Transposase DDE domain